MADELSELRARVEQLENRCDLLLELADQIHGQVADTQTLEDVAIMPLLLLLAGEGHRAALRDRLAELVIRASASLGADQREPRDRRFQLRAAYWKRMLEARPTWHGFEADGWMPPDPAQR